MQVMIRLTQTRDIWWKNDTFHVIDIPLPLLEIFKNFKRTVVFFKDDAMVLEHYNDYRE